MNRPQLLTVGIAGALAACARGSGILLPSGESLSKARASSPLTAGDYSWKSYGGGRWDMQWGWKDNPFYQIYFTYPRDSKYPGQTTLCGELGFANGQVYCAEYFDYSPPPPPWFHSWHLQWSPGSWKPGTIKHLFNGHLLRIGVNAVTLYDAHGEKVSAWYYGHLRASHYNFLPNRFTAHYAFDPRQVQKHGATDDTDCTWEVVGFLGATITTMVLAWTAETVVGGIAAAASFMQMLKDGHEVLACGR